MSDHLLPLFPKLNIPAVDLTLLWKDNKHWVWDITRKKYVLLTQEEWVRQNFLNFLVTYLDYPKGLIRTESGMIYNKLSKRTDLLVFLDEKPICLIECKSPQIKLSKSVLQQVFAYNIGYKAPWVGITNGLRSYFWKYEENKFEQISSIPSYEEIKKACL